MKIKNDNTLSFDPEMQMITNNNKHNHKQMRIITSDNKRARQPLFVCSFLDGHASLYLLVPAHLSAARPPQLAKNCQPSLYLTNSATIWYEQVTCTSSTTLCCSGFSLCTALGSTSYDKIYKRTLKTKKNKNKLEPCGLAGRFAYNEPYI